MKTILGTAIAALLLAQDPAPGGGVTAADAGIGFLFSGDLANLPPSAVPREADRFVGRRDGWVPFQITLANDGPEIRGVLTVRPVNRGETPVEYSKRVSLPRGARKRLAFPICNNWVGALEVVLTDESGSVVKVNGHRSLWIDQPRLVPMTGRFALIVTRATGTFAHFLRQTQTGILAADRVLAPVRPDRLPSTVLDLSGVQVVIVDDVPLDELTEAQQEALQQWVARGGVLVVSVFQSAPRLKGTRLEPWLPGTPGSIRNVDRVPALGALGIPCTLRSPQAVLTFEAAAGARCWHAADPVIVERRVEQGRLLLCGFPFSAPFLESWEGAPFFFEALAGAAGEPAISLPAGGMNRDFRRDLASLMKQSVAKTIPSLRAVAGIVAAYLAVILILPYVSFRLLRRLEWAWVAVLAIAAAGTAGVYGYGLRLIDSGSTAYRVTLVEGGAMDGPRLRHNFWCLFTSRGSRLTLDFEDAPMAAPFGAELALRGKASSIEPLHVALDDDAQIRGLRAHVQDSVTFETTDAARVPGRIEFVADGQAELSGRLSVIDGFPLYEAFVVHRNRVHPVKAGTFRVGPDTPEAPGPGGDRFHQLAYRGALARAKELSQEGPVLFYRYDAPPALNHPGIPERAVHFGLLRPEAVLPSTQAVHWQVHCVRPPDPNFRSSPAEYRLIGSGLPPDWTVDRLHIQPDYGWQRVYEVFDWARDTWRRIESPQGDVPAEGLLSRMPQGQVVARLRIHPCPVDYRETSIQVGSYGLRRSGR